LLKESLKEDIEKYLKMPMLMPKPNMKNEGKLAEEEKMA
jgi:hypothetical protein